MSDFLDEDMNEFFGTQAPPKIQPQPQISAPQTQAIAQQPHNTELSSPFSQIDIDLGIPGIVVGNTGTTVSRYPIDKVKISPAKKVRFSVLVDKVIVVPYHYFTGVGSVICNGEKCCQLSGKRNVRYVYYVVEYTDTDSNGKVTGGGVELKALSLPESQYQQLAQIQLLKGNLSQYDIVVSATEKGGGDGFLDVCFTEASQAIWLRSPQAVAYIRDKFSKDGKFVLDGVARNLTGNALVEAIKAAEEKPDVDLSKMK